MPQRLNVVQRDRVEQELSSLTLTLAREILDAPHICSVTAEWPDIQPDNCCLLTLLCPPRPDKPSEKGRIIGHHGLTIRALRRILSVAGARRNVRVIFDAIDPDEPPSPIERSAHA